ncbi:LLM class flavin-dependent oxidoreductase [Mesorhizobium sp. B4-1-4]|uniref:LLM class flavin-dependent oxidoreductase n=1 Tax=Mesorhizobium sp. B4-1-4 TaxID=2589888 RepID=UPI00112C1685|nr:LLM class flavin-dependent oxidoreductase [Mesorhizobium sp. B4-1-4]UCI31265.1 LLM class flavin-dependent oxidoreductase [Mesorhizobium sp. B4-1-4]
MGNTTTMHLAVSLDLTSMPTPDFGLVAGLARKAEEAGLDMAIIVDSAPGSAHSSSSFEATTLLAALATVTSRIGLVARASTIAHQPYNLARRFASLDIISHGRTGWNATVAQSPREAANFSRPDGFSEGDFRRRTEEYIGIVQGLWQGWDADALLFDKSGGRFHYPEKMHLLDHKGEFFSVRGPLNIARSPQDMPVLVLSGLSESDMDVAARTADVVLLEHGPSNVAKARIDDLRRRVTAAGRDPGAMKVLMNVAGSDRAAADRLEEWLRSEGCDGFNVLVPAQLPALDNFVDRVVPELRRRGLVRGGYRGTTLRSHLGLAGGGSQ